MITTHRMLNAVITVCCLVALLALISVPKTGKPGFAPLGDCGSLPKLNNVYEDVYNLAGDLPRATSPEVGEVVANKPHIMNRHPEAWDRAWAELQKGGYTRYDCDDGDAPGPTTFLFKKLRQNRYSWWLIGKFVEGGDARLAVTTSMLDRDAMHRLIEQADCKSERSVGHDNQGPAAVK
ncbi:hypothetical protein GF373_17760 [bacterium]|nr:hypothetical protein [bacterium]